MSNIIRASASDLVGGNHPVQKKIALAREENEELRGALMGEVARRVQLQCLLVCALNKLGASVEISKADMESATKLDVTVERMKDGDGKVKYIKLAVEERRTGEDQPQSEPGVRGGAEAGGGTEGSGDPGTPR